MKKIIKLDSKDLKGLHFFVEGFNFPVVVASYNEWEEQQLSYLVSNAKKIHMNTETICQWCIYHKIKYQILYPVKKISILLHPYKSFKFIQLKNKLNYSL